MSISYSKRWTFWLGLGNIVSLAIALFTTPSFAQTSDDPLEEAKPAPASVGADIPLTYFGPPPSEVQRELIGPYKLLKAGQVDEDAGTVTLPLYQGRMKDGRQVWFVLTDTDDKLNAEQLGLNWSPKLTYADTGRAVRVATMQKDGTLVFASSRGDKRARR